MVVVSVMPSTAVIGIATVTVSSALSPGPRFTDVEPRLTENPWLLLKARLKVSAMSPKLVMVCAYITVSPGLAVLVRFGAISTATLLSLV